MPTNSFVQAVVAGLALWMLVPAGLGSVLHTSIIAFCLILIICATVVGTDRVGAGVLMLAYATLPFDDVRAPIGPLQPSDVLLAIGFMFLLPRLARSKLHLPIAFVVGAIALLTIGTMSAVNTDQAGANFVHVLSAAKGLVLLPLLVTWWQPGRRTMIAIVTSYLFGNGVNVLAAVREGPGVSGRYLGLSSHENVMAYGLALSIALVPFLLTTLPRRFHWILAAASCLFLYGIWITGSRGALLAAGAVAVVFPLLKRSIAAALGVMTLSFPALWFVDRAAKSADETSALGRLLGQGSATDADAARQRGSQKGIDQFFDHPFLGDGLVTVWGSHNSYLQVAAAMGLFAFVAYILILGSILRPLIAVPPPFGLLAMPAMAAAMIDLVNPLLGASPVWAVLALALSANRLATDDGTARGSPPPAGRPGDRNRSATPLSGREFATKLDATAVNSPISRSAHDDVRQQER